MLVLSLIIFLVLADQLTKSLVVANFSLGMHRDVISHFFRITYVQNTGAAWGIMSGFNHWLVGLSFIMLILMLIYRRYFILHTRMQRVAYSFMMAGIIGNLIDRVKWGYVVDFLDLHWNIHHFPSFNIADSAICTGVCLYMLSQMIQQRSESTELTKQDS